MAREHAVTRPVRDSAAVLDVISGSELGEPFPAPLRERPFIDEVGAHPGRLRIAYSAVAADGYPTDPDCVSALDDAVQLCDNSATSSKSDGCHRSPPRSARPLVRPLGRRWRGS